VPVTVDGRAMDPGRGIPLGLTVRIGPVALVLAES